MSRFLATALLLAATSLPHAALAQSATHAAVERPAFGEKLKLAGIPNAGKIDDNLFRGAQPHAEGFSQLKNLGITTIVDLRSEDPGKIAWERQQAESLGIRFINIPVSGWSSPANEQVAQFLALFRDDAKQRVFVHCRFGEDRTGVFVAAYRIARDEWTADQAVSEMYFFGFHGFWHPAMKSYVYAFPGRLQSTPALQVLRAHTVSSAQ